MSNAAIAGFGFGVTPEQQEWLYNRFM